jgi:hypothetical protein
MDNQTQFRIWYNPLICDKYDWRIKFVWNLESPLKKVTWNDNTHDWDIGSVFLLTQPFLFEKNKIDLTVPDMTSIYLNISNNNFQAAKNILNNFDKKKIKWFIHLESNAFDYFEEITVSIVFAISALEVFFNQLLLNKDKKTIFLTKVNEKDWTIKELRRWDIEWLSLEDKYFEIMPIMFQIDKKKLGKIKSKFASLNKIRNDIIHLKSWDLEPQTDIKKNSIWRKMFEQSKENPAIISLEIIKFFYQESWMELPRFLRLVPFKK